MSACLCSGFHLQHMEKEILYSVSCYMKYTGLLKVFTLPFKALSKVRLTSPRAPCFFCSSDLLKELYVLLVGIFCLLPRVRSPFLGRTPLPVTAGPFPILDTPSSFFITTLFSPAPTEWSIPFATHPGMCCHPSDGSQNL